MYNGTYWNYSSILIKVGNYEELAIVTTKDPPIKYLGTWELGQFLQITIPVVSTARQ